MRNKIITLLLLLGCMMSAFSQTEVGENVKNNVQYDTARVKADRPLPYFEFRLGFEVGGTVPFPLPAQIRKINGFAPLGNFSAQALSNMPFNKRWEMLLGLRFERKGMTTKSTVKDYNMSIQDDEGGTIMGRWTGDVTMSADQWMLTLPVAATFNITEKGKIRLGCYYGYVFKGLFYGEVQNGYLREGDPTGAKIEVGEEPQSFEFNEDMRRFQWGLTLGGEWSLGKRFSVFADLDWGLNNIFIPTFETISFDMYPIFGTLGIGYSFK